jgi:hypothetical protein
MTYSFLKLGLPLLTAIVAGCADIATRPNSMGSNASPASFSLKTSDAVSGSMNVAVPDEKPSGAQFF